MWAVMRRVWQVIVVSISIVVTGPIAAAERGDAEVQSFRLGDYVFPPAKWGEGTAAYHKCMR